MQAILISEAEMDGLAGLSHLAYTIYLHLRRRMDLTTRIVGLKTYLSYQALAELSCVEVPKGRGFQRIKPSINQIRAVLDSLTRAGLLSKVQDGLVFLLAKAQGVSSRQKQTKQEHHKLDAGENSIKLSTCSNTPQSNIAKHHIHQDSVYKSNACSDQHAPLSNEAMEVLAWLNEENIEANTKAKPADAIRLYKSGKATVQAAAKIAKGVRQRDGSTAPINFGLILKCLPKGAFSPAPKAVTPSEASTPQTNAAPRRITASEPDNDPTAIAKGLAFFNKIALKTGRNVGIKHHA